MKNGERILEFALIARTVVVRSTEGIEMRVDCIDNVR